ncbi:RNA-directed DNA polymerase, eukaryota [Tanacetum coccineum]
MLGSILKTHVLKTHNSFEALDCEFVPSIVLDDDCLNSRDLSKTLLGRVKELALLSNLKKVLKNKGFDEIKLQYMGELWVLLEFPSTKTKELFQENRGAGSWFSSIKFPPGFTPNGVSMQEDIGRNVNDVTSPKRIVEEEQNEQEWNNANKGSKDEMSGSVCSGFFKKSMALQSGSLFFETKMENMNMWCVKACWGNYTFDYAHSDSVGYMVEIQYGKVIIMGDFNEVRRKSERFGSAFNVQGAVMFNSFIANAVLEEIPLGGSSFTWCHKSANKMSKLDRFLISENLFNSFLDICATSLDRFLSDHRPILLRESNYDYGPIPFRYFNHWVELDGFNTFVTDTWNYAPVESNAMRNVMQKFKFLKEEIKKIDAEIDNGLASDTTINRRTKVLNSIQHLDKIQAMDMAQKAKVKWAIKGDDNSRYFHGILNKKRSQSNIRGIMVDGKWQDNLKIVKSEFLLHFRKRFERPSDNRIFLDMNFPKTISLDQQTELESAVSKEEVKKAVWDCGSDKSPGPDGFLFGFYRKFWSCIKNDVFAVVNYFFTFGDIPKGCNSCFIALILKVHDATLVKDFRPISLIGSIYKIIAKILANRLVSVLGDIVNEVQSAFISDRQILDGPFILNEVIQWCKSKKKQSLIFKVDFEKAYDSVRWDFLDDVLKKFGFGNKWCDWIQKCLRSSRGSILINGSPTEEFSFFKGLKQGDPLSPFLFILIMESLHLSFQSVVDVDLFKGINLSPLVNLSHMFYADDAVFVGQWCDDNINTLVHVLECFFRASGLRINMSKSKIMGVNVGDDKIKVAASKLGCLILNTPFTYLGTKVGGNMSRVQAWTEIIDKVKSRLSNWKLKSLSIGGRLTLLKSVLGSIPIFHMSIFKVPLTVLRSLESIRCQFFNGHELKSNKSSWVKWNSVLAAKEKGGLGVSSLFALNRALLMKWFWRFYSHNDSLWSRVIKAIYGVDGEVNKVSKYASRSCWRDIINEVRKLKDQGINMRDFMYIKVGNGETTKFWDDIWIGSKPLKLLFPRIYALDNIKDASICMKLNEPSLDNNFRRSIRGGIEQSQFKELTDLLIPIVLNPCPDRWFWSLEGSGEFSVASIRRFIDDQRLLTVDSKTLWIKSVPIKVNILAWKIKLEALPTRFNISRRDKLRVKFALGGILHIRMLTPSLNAPTGWPLYAFNLKNWQLICRRDSLSFLLILEDKNHLKGMVLI